MLEKIKLQAEQFNQEFFEGELPVSDIKFIVSNRMTRTRGTMCSDGTLKLSSLVVAVDGEWQATLIHELIHFWQLEKFGTMNHGRTFQTKAFLINHQTNNKYKIGTKSSSNNVEYRALMAEKTKVQSQFILVNARGHVNFMKSLEESDIQTAKDRGVTIYVNHEAIQGVRHNKNFKAYLYKRYYYPKSLLAKEGIDLSTLNRL